jgi:hypothetical protein
VEKKEKSNSTFMQVILKKEYLKLAAHFINQMSRTIGTVDLLTFSNSLIASAANGQLGATVTIS